MEQQIEKQTKSISLKITKTAILLALALSFQIGLMPLAQPAVGPLVNMTLLIAAITVGPAQAVMIGCITPLMAFMLGIMPLPMLVPVVMLGNGALIIVFHYLSIKPLKRYLFVSLLAGAFAKFAVMASMIRLVSQLFMPGIPVRLIHAFSLPQFYTAMLGGVAALIVLRYLPESYKARRIVKE